MENPMHIGHRIKAVRTERGLSLPDLAKEAGISKGLLYHIENSETPPNPSLETLNKISQALKITLAMLLEKRGVKGKRILPERLEPELEEMIKALNKQNEPLSETALDALYLLQERSGGFKTVQQWRFLYDSICLALSERR
jgi:transcriptional regulator with XRE-family HTH domain